MLHLLLYIRKIHGIILKSTNKKFHLKTVINLMKKQQHCCKGHPAPQKHSSLVLSAGKSSDINFPA